MTPYVSDSDFTLYVGDVRDCLRELPAASVHTVVTSPPYWGLRDYSTEGQIGLEPTPEAFVAAMVDVFREVWRVLRDDGTLWLNLGDSYASSGSGAGADNSAHKGEDAGNFRNGQSYVGQGNPRTAVDGLKVKDLCGIPWRVAFALQADGWYLRSDIVWSKPNPMPESVTDRPTKAHEYVFLLSKSPRYFYDADAIRERVQEWNTPTGRENAAGIASPRHEQRKQAGKLAGGHSYSVAYNNPAGRNVRSVWEIATQPYPDAHFATFPEALPERCIKAGTSERGCCPECGAPWERETSTSYENPGNRTTNGPRSIEQRHETAGFGQRLEKRVETTGWRPTCECFGWLYRWKEYDPSGYGVATVHEVYVWPERNEHEIAARLTPAVCLDPFMGSGTTALLARRLGRHSIGVELNPEYAALCARRLQQLSLLA